jgi:hypothetical protein
MTTKEHDTDPSTPSARRPNKMRSTSPPPPADTDPGLAPPPMETEPPSAPLGIKVPSNRPPPRGADTFETALPVGLATNDDSPKASKKDSVEILLDGMAELRLDRARTTPQTAGQASASYHAEHQVHASERPPPIADEPKVLLEQPPTVTMRLVRGASLRPGEADPTWIRPEQTLRRVFIALAAGLAVVIAIFVWLQAASRSGERAQEGAAKPEAIRASQPMATAPPGVAPPRAPVAPAVDTPPTAAAGVAAEGAAAVPVPGASAGGEQATGKTPPGHGSAASPPHAGDGHGNAAGHRKANPAGAASTDLGEFKTTY